MFFSKHTPALLWSDQVFLRKLIVREVKDAAHPALAWFAQVVRTVQSCSEANHQQVSVRCFCLDFIFPPNTREVKTASWFCFTGEAEKDCALLWILLTSGATKIISKEIWFLLIYHDDNSGADYWSGRQLRHEFTKCVLDIWIVAGTMRLVLR